MRAMNQFNIQHRTSNGRDPTTEKSRLEAMNQQGSLEQKLKAQISNLKKIQIRSCKT